MDEDKKNRLDALLRALLESSRQEKAGKKKGMTPPGTGSVIRRRRGQPDKRIKP
jgi:hypothetical protein